MKKSVLRQIKEKCGYVKDDIATSNTYTTMKQTRYITKNLKADNAKRMMWEKKRDCMQQVCGLKPDGNGLYDYDKIDMTNPIVELEYFLCDPRNRQHTSQHLPRDKRQRYLEQHLSKEAVELFWDCKKGELYDKSGTPWNTEGQVPYHELMFRFRDAQGIGLGCVRNRGVNIPDTPDEGDQNSNVKEG